ncbi:MAG: YDG domain-containing protein, partial [Oscillospiraceae bacterium]
TNIDYTGHHVDIPFTIAKAPVTVAASGYTVTKAWDGTTNPGSGSGSLHVTGGVNSEQVTAIPHDYPSSDVGNHTVTVDLALAGNATDNYVLKNSTITVTGTIIRSAVSPNPPAAPTSAAAGDVSVRLQTVTVDGETVEYAKGDNSTTPGTWQDSTTFGTLTPNTQYYFFARVKGNGNHPAGVASAATAISTVKGVHPQVAVRDIPILNGTASSGTITLTDLFGGGNVPHGAAFQSLTGAATYLQSFSKADDTTLSYVSLRNPAGTAGTDTFTITVTSARYQDITLTVRFITTDKAPATIIASMSDKVYDGTPITARPNPTAKAGDETITLDYTFRWTQGGATLVGQPKNAGSYQLEIEGSNNTHLGSATIAVTIEKA